VVFVFAEADIPAVRATQNLPFLDLTLTAQRTGALGDKLQLAVATRRAHVGYLPAVA
jgi:hypothetical protein